MSIRTSSHQFAPALRSFDSRSPVTNQVDCYLHKIPPTPLVPVQLEEDVQPIWCKLEFLNPSGSTKDRIARHILDKARRRGVIEAGSTVVEASSGSTSIAFAIACAQMGLRFID